MYSQHSTHGSARHFSYGSEKRMGEIRSCERHSHHYAGWYVSNTPQGTRKSFFWRGMNSKWYNQSKAGNKNGTINQKRQSALIIYISFAYPSTVGVVFGFGLQIRQISLLWSMRTHWRNVLL